MKFQRLELLAFGPFTETVLDFSTEGGESNLHIIYGPNEAGKSSALRAIHGSLFGIPGRCVDNHVHDHPDLRIGAVLENSDAETLAFVRRKGRKETLLNPANLTGGVYPSDALKPFLGGMDGETFEKVYVIGHEELRRGGEAMQSLQGLIGESLFAATVGGTRATELLQKLDIEASELFDARKRKARLKESAKAYSQLQKESRECRLSGPKWDELRSKLSKAIAHRDQIVGKSLDIERESHRLGRFRRAIGWIAKRNAARQRMGELSSAVVLPETYSRERRSQILAERTHLEKQVHALQQQLQGDDSVHRQIEAIDVPETLLDSSETIERLTDQRAVFYKAQEDRQKLVRDCEITKDRIVGLMRDLGVEDSTEDIDQFRLRSDERLLIQNLGNTSGQLHTRPTSLRKELATLEEELGRRQQQLDGLESAKLSAALPNAVQEARACADLAQESADERSDLVHRRQRAERRLAAIGQWNGGLDKIASLQLPLRETMDRFEKGYNQLDQQIAAGDLEQHQVESDLAAVEEQIKTLLEIGHVPSELELKNARTDRDDVLARLRASFREDTPVDRSSQTDGAIELTAAIRSADELADRLRREAERAAKLASQKARRENLGGQNADLYQRRNGFTAQRDSLQLEWQGLWSHQEIVALPPSEMRSWIGALEKLLVEADELAEQSRRLTIKETRIASALERLVEALSSVSDETARECGDTKRSAPSERSELDAGVAHRLESLLIQAETALEQQETIRRRRERLTGEIEESHQRVAELRIEVATAEQELEAWQVDWREATRKLACGRQVTVEQANDRMQRLADVFELQHDVEQKGKRIEHIDENSGEFDQSAKRLAGRLEIPTDGMTAADLVESFQSSLRHAQSNQSQLQQLVSKRNSLSSELDASQVELQTYDRELDAMRNLAGVKDWRDLPRAEKESQELGESHLRLKEADSQLHELCGNSPLMEFVDEAGAWDADELTTQIEQAQTQMEALQQQRDESVGNVREWERELESADGSALSAQLDEQALGVLSGMHDDARRYMRLRLATQMLRLQIEIHRSENEDPLLQRASVLFSRMTGGEFSGLRTDYDSDDPTIVGVRHNDERVPVIGMSDGTCDQLYLALRLAYIEKQLLTFEPMPLVVDDILIHFDNDRAKATLKVLSELANQTQVIFFTHHEHLLNMATECLDKDSYRVHQLDGRSHGAFRGSNELAASRPK